jgi:hypothetical protein
MENLAEEENTLTICLAIAMAEIGDQEILQESDELEPG